MKEIKRIIIRLVEESVKSISMLSIAYVRQKPIISVNIIYNSFSNISISKINDSTVSKEISSLQEQLVLKYNELLKLVIKPNQNELKEHADTRYRYLSNSEEITSYDKYGILYTAYESVKGIIRNRIENKLKEISKLYNDYLNSMEEKVFAAYTKGMSSDDFLDLTREHISEIQTKSISLTKELQEYGY